MLLHEIAHGRAGDKGDTANISVIAYDAAYFPHLVEHVTEQRVRECLAGRAPSAVRRYLLPKLGAMNFVIEGALEGGVNESLNLDAHGKCLSFRILAMEIPDLP